MHKLSKEERIKKHRDSLRFPTMVAMTGALGLNDFWYRCKESYSNFSNSGWRDATISIRGFVLVEFMQNRAGECIITKLYKVAPQFFYDVTPTNPYFDTNKQKWVVGPNPIIKLIRTVTHRHQILDLYGTGIHHAFEGSTDSTAGDVFRIYSRTTEAVERFKNAVPLMILWLDQPKNTGGREWHKARRSLQKGTIIGVLRHFSNMLSGKVGLDEIF